MSSVRTAAFTVAIDKHKDNEVTIWPPILPFKREISATSIYFRRSFEIAGVNVMAEANLPKLGECYRNRVRLSNGRRRATGGKQRSNAQYYEKDLSHTLNGVFIAERIKSAMPRSGIR